ncbi:MULTISPECIES: acyltransferase [unclassified Adlercreutzia]|uniref:acyltransferase family protein n=1 Tax=unclassified Adlercreutzia TaxID=2636013 RepID=UPI0013EC91CF|nr:MULTISPECIES: acyltransferase [unclassified Adlercreutzia]
MKLFSATAMILVVVGHCSSQGFEGPFALFPPYNYQVASFVFVSGYFYKESSENDVLAYVAKKAKRLLVPLLLIDIAYGVFISFAHKTLGIQYGAELSFNSVIIQPFTSGHQFWINCPMWFIAPLFFCEVSNVVLRKAAASIENGVAKESIFLLLYLCAGAIAIHTGGSDGLGESWLLLLMRTFFFLSCFGMGRFYRTVLEQHDTLSSIPYFALVFAVQLICAWLNHGNLSYYPSWCTFPGSPTITLLSTAACIAFLLRLCRIIGPRIGKSKGVLCIANNSFSIMCHHMLGFFLLNTIFLFCSTYTPICSSFDIISFQTVWNYHYDPQSLPQFASVYVVFAIAFSIGIHKSWVALKCMFRNIIHVRQSRRTTC